MSDVGPDLLQRPSFGGLLGSLLHCEINMIVPFYTTKRSTLSCPDIQFLGETSTTQFLLVCACSKATHEALLSKNLLQRAR